MRGFVIIFMLGIISSCKSDQWDIVDLAESLGCHDFTGVLQSTGWQYPLGGGHGNYTVFVPNDAAFNAIPAHIAKRLNNNWQMYFEMIAFHIVKGNIYASQLTDNRQLNTMLKGSDIRINIYDHGGKKITATGSNIITPNQNATNGIIHIIDKVMYQWPVIDLHRFINERSDMRSLDLLMKVAGMQSMLKGGNMTFFAPLDTAFANLTEEFWKSAFNDTKLINKILGYHLVNSTLYTEGLYDTQTITTVANNTLTINVNKGNVTVNHIPVEEADIPVTNGVVHVIDTLLFPIPDYF